MKIKKSDGSVLALTREHLIQLQKEVHSKISIEDFEKNLTTLFLKANVDSNELTLLNLHEVHKEIQHDKEEEKTYLACERQAGKPFGNFRRKFTNEDENIFVELIKLFFPECHQGEKPDGKKLSAILGIPCSVTTWPINLEVTIHKIIGIGNFVKKLEELGAWIITTDEHVRIGYYSLGAWVAPYSLNRFNQGINIAYDQLPSSSKIQESSDFKFLFPVHHPIVQEKKASFDLGKFLTALQLDSESQKGISFLDCEEFFQLRFPSDYAVDKIQAIAENLISKGFRCEIQKPFSCDFLSNNFVIELKMVGASALTQWLIQQDSVQTNDKILSC